MTESTPLLKNVGSELSQRTARTLKKLTAELDQRTPFVTFWHLVLSTWNNHWVSACCSFVSCVICVREGYATINIFDSLIFKSIFVVFGFAIGFRNVRGNARRSEALTSIRNLLHNVWDILVMIPDESRERIQTQLLDACQAIAEYVITLACRRTFQIGMAGLQPFEEKDDDDKVAKVDETGLRMGSHTFVAATLLTCEDVVDRLTEREPHTQKYRRHWWLKKNNFEMEYYNLCDLAIPSVSDSYVMLINTCLFVFSIVLPWGLACGEIKIHGWQLFSAGTFLILNTALVNAIIFGLNTLAAGHEDPFSSRQGEKIDIEGIVEVFSVAVREYDTIRRSHSSVAGDTVSLHKLVCDHGKQSMPIAHCRQTLLDIVAHK